MASTITGAGRRRAGASIFGRRAHAWVCALALLLGALLYLPTLDAGLSGDDFLQWHRLSPSSRTALVAQDPGCCDAHAGLKGLFQLVAGPQQVQQWKANGRLLWIASDDLTLRFWRPLGELSHLIDYRLWPHRPALMHVHSLLWFLALLALTARLYRGLALPAAAWGAVLFATSSLHFFCVSWLAARNQVMAACCVTLCVDSFHRWRQTGHTRSVLVSWLSLALGLASAEAAVAALAYVLAYAIVMEQGQSRSHRVLGVLPHLSIVIAWRWWYTQHGFGAWGSGSYIDPGHDPWRFVQATLLRVPPYVMALWLGVSASVTAAMGIKGKLIYALAVAVLAGGAWQLWARLRAQVGTLWRPRTLQVLDFLLLGSLLALVPACAVEPEDRVLILAELGVSGILAASLAAWLPLRALWRARQRAPEAWSIPTWQMRLAASAMALSLGVHLVVFPLATLAQAWAIKRLVAPINGSEPLSIQWPADADAGHTHVVLLNPPVPSLLAYYPLIRAHAGMRSPAAISALAFGNAQALSLTVLDGSRLRMRVLAGSHDRLERDLTLEPFVPATLQCNGEICASVQSVSDQGEPQEVVFGFAKPLADRHWVFMRWVSDHYEAMQWPKPGQSLEVPAPDVGALARDRLQHWHAPGDDG